MKWRKWPEEKPKSDGIVYCRNNNGSFTIDLNNSNAMDFGDSIFEWLDESEEAFEEVARERGWVRQ